MKKCLTIGLKKFKRLCFCVIFLLLLMGISFTTMARVAASDNPCLTIDEEKIIMEMIVMTAESDGMLLEDITYFAKNVYFANGSWAGYVIEFNSNDEKGYAIVFKHINKFKMIELFIGRYSPFYNKQGIYIYPSLGYYYIKNNDKIYEVSNASLDDFYELESDALFYAAGSSKGDEKTDVPETLSIAYKRALKAEYNISDFYTSYSTSLTDHARNCANAAGLTMLNYWNRKYNNDLLKLDSSVLNYAGNIYFDIYNSSVDARKEYMGIFYDYMDTNWIFGTGGTLPGDCYNGFEKLIKEKGYKVKRNRNLSIDDIQSFIRQGVPVFITSQDYYFTTYPNKSTLPAVINGNGNQTLTIQYERSYGIANSHTFVGYGYTFYLITHDVEKSVWSPVWYNPFRYITVIEEESYYEEFIKIADGWGGNCYFNYSQSDMHDNAAIEVYK